MRVPRLFLPFSLAAGAEITLDVRAHHHATQVLRLRAGDALVLFNGNGGEYAATLTAVHRREAQATIGELLPSRPRPLLPITLAQGVSRGERMDFTLQKAVELGVTAISPLITSRVQGTDERRLAARMAHWQGVVIAACEQCGRDDLPALRNPQHLDDFLTSEPGKGLSLLLDPEAARGLSGITDRPNSVMLLIGPEGGLDEMERTRAKAVGFIPIRLGPRILRTETAALAAIATVQTQWGDSG